jgi:hypothetical protein
LQKVVLQTPTSPRPGQQYIEFHSAQSFHKARWQTDAAAFPMENY